MVSLSVLLSTFTVALLHPLIPSHWLCFVVVGRAQGWGVRKTLGVAAVAGLLHVLSTIILGLALVTAGRTFLEQEGTVERLSALVLVGLGALYLTFHLFRAGHRHEHDKAVTEKVAFVALLFSLAWCAVIDRQSTRPPRDTHSVRPIVVATVASLLLAVHPMMTQAVGYISGRSEVLCLTWLLLALLSARRWMHARDHRWLVTTIGLWLAALATKETAVMFPVAVLLYDRWVSPGTTDDGRRRLVGLHLPLFGLATVAALARVAVFVLVEHDNTVTAHGGFALLELDVVRRYLGMLVMPGEHSIFHAVLPVSGLSDPRVLFAVLVIGALLACAWR